MAKCALGVWLCDFLIFFSQCLFYPHFPIRLLLGAAVGHKVLTGGCGHLQRSGWTQAGSTFTLPSCQPAGGQWGQSQKMDFNVGLQCHGLWGFLMAVIALLAIQQQ